MVEHFLDTEGVRGSNPLSRTIFLPEETTLGCLRLVISRAIDFLTESRLTDKEMSSAASPKGSPGLARGVRACPRITHAVFDFDGTLSWLRHGWPELMAEVFRQHVPVLPRETEDAFHELLLDDILSLNGKPSIHQMLRCVARLSERGGAPPRPEALLEEYQRRLDAAIAERTAEILNGKASPDEFVVYGARRFLEALRDRGVTLVILSGTIEHRVKEEAELLDLARYFGAHIYGGRGDAVQFSKRAVISRLLREERIAGDQLVALGDGPVEIAVAKDAGGKAIALATDEEVNGSGKLHPQKEKLLRAAGADIIVPDYRDFGLLLKQITGESGALSEVQN